jgi:hypothetical protein
MIPDLNIPGIPDEVTRENMRKINDFIKTNPVLVGQFEFFEITADKAEDALPFKHGFTFTPKDVLVTGQTGSSTVTFLSDQFTDEFVYLKTTGPVTVRAFIGSFVKGKRS